MLLSGAVLLCLFVLYSTWRSKTSCNTTGSSAKSKTAVIPTCFLSEHYDFINGLKPTNATRYQLKRKLFKRKVLYYANSTAGYYSLVAAQTLGRSKIKISTRKACVICQRKIGKNITRRLICCCCTEQAH